MTIIVIMLIYAISLELQLLVYITIHNECSSIKLASLVYFSNGATCPELFNQQIEIGTKMSVSFEIDTIRNKFESVLLLKLESHVKSDDQYNMNTSTTRADKNETTHVYMLVIWEAKDAGPCERVVLIEHTKEFTWNEDKLKKLYDKNYDWIKEREIGRFTRWLMGDNMVLSTSSITKGMQGILKLSISISEEKRYYNKMRPLCVDLER
jgi:hypothetical protein